MIILYRIMRLLALWSSFYVGAKFYQAIDEKDPWKAAALGFFALQLILMAIFLGTIGNEERLEKLEEREKKSQK